MTSRSYVAAKPVSNGVSVGDTILDALHLVFGFIWAILHALFRTIVHFLTPTKLKDIKDQVALVR